MTKHIVTSYHYNAGKLVSTEKVEIDYPEGKEKAIFRQLFTTLAESIK